MKYILKIISIFVKNMMKDNSKWLYLLAGRDIPEEMYDVVIEYLEWRNMLAFESGVVTTEDALNNSVDVLIELDILKRLHNIPIRTMKDLQLNRKVSISDVVNGSGKTMMDYIGTYFTKVSDLISVQQMVVQNISTRYEDMREKHGDSIIFIPYKLIQRTQDDRMVISRYGFYYE
jgi:hypothetical protein